MTTTTTQYGTRAANGAIYWPDEDGEISFDGDYADPTRYTEGQLLAKARIAGVELVSRLVTTSEPEVVTPTLPSEHGSVIRARIRRGDAASARLFFRYGAVGSDAWVAATPLPGFRQTATTAELELIEVVLDGANY